MHKLRKMLYVAGIAALILACDLAGAPAQPVEDVATIVASTLQAMSPAAPLATATLAAAAPQGVPVNYKNVSFILPPGLATDAAPLTMPAQTEDTGGPWGAAPEYIRFRFDGYNLPSAHFDPVTIDVYPAQAYAAVNAGANISLQRLQGLLADPSKQLTHENLPQVPGFNAAAIITAQAQRIQFQNGSGVRMISQYGQAVGPISNNQTFYHFQGLTSDGKSYIIAVLAIQAPFLEKGNDPNETAPAGGVPFPGYSSPDAKVYEDYFNAVTDKLNNTPADQFSPSLATLDALIQSITVTP